MAAVHLSHCKSHCVACGSHFSSDKAFDAHRQFEPGHKDDWDHRICVEPMDDKAFAAKGRPGICKLAKTGHPQVGVTVWTLAYNLRRPQPDWAAIR